MNQIDLNESNQDIGSGLSSLAVKMSLNHQKTKETFSDALEQFKVLILSLKDKKKQMKKQAGKRQEEILVVQDKMLKSSLLFEESVSVLKNGGGLKRITCPFILRLGIFYC